LPRGINDWGGISPVTRDFINPEAAWPQIATIEKRTAKAGFVLKERLAIYPEFARAPEFLDEGVRSSLNKHLDTDCYARVD
jgi:FO synthase